MGAKPHCVAVSAQWGGSDGPDPPSQTTDAPLTFALDHSMGAGQGVEVTLFYWIYDVPSWSAAFFFALVFVAVSCLGVLFVRPFLRLLVGRRQGFNEVIGYVLSFVSLIYGVLLGMLAVVTYQNLTEADRVSSHEASTVAALYEDVAVYPDELSAQLRGDLKRYTKAVIDTEWPLLRRGTAQLGQDQNLKRFLERLTTFEPKGASHQILHAETLREFNALVELRRARLHMASVSIPGIMWYTIVMGAFLCLVLIWMFDSSVVSQLLLGGVAAFGMSTMVCLSALMDSPFRGELSVPPAAFEAVHAALIKN